VDSVVICDNDNIKRERI